MSLTRSQHHKVYSSPLLLIYISFSNSEKSDSHYLLQSTNIYSKGKGNKHFRFCKPFSVCLNSSYKFSCIMKHYISFEFFQPSQSEKNKVLYLWAVQKWTEFGPPTLTCWPIFSAIYLFVQSQYSCFRTAHWDRQIYRLEQCLWTVLFILVLTVKMLFPKLLHLILSSAFPAEC